MDQPQTERRLCALVAVDIAGYSGRAEADEATAVSGVAQLSERIAEAARAEGGRVFNTAGDGFMLEFPTVTGALTAAHAIASTAQPPVRVGVHLGEVHVTASGDLLGHGVNVAARLQALAMPGEVVVSDDVRRAARGPLAERLQPVGRVRLAKMKEVGAVFSLTTDGGARRRLMRWGRWAAVAAALLVVIGGAAAAWRVLPRPATAGDLTVAVQSFKPNGPGAPDLAYGEVVADRMTAALADRRAAVVSRERVRKGDLAGARLVITGDVERDGPVMRVQVRLDDARAGRTLWSGRYERPADEAVALQDQTASNVADIVAGLLELARDSDTSRPEVLAEYLTAVDTLRLHRGNSDATREAFHRVVQLAPNSASAHAIYANIIMDSIVYSAASPQEIAALRAEASAEAKRAIALAPNDAASYGALFATLPRRDFLGREAVLAKGLAANPDDTLLLDRRADLLRTVGLTAQGSTLQELNFPLRRAEPSRVTALVFTRAGTGRYADAHALSQTYLRLIPNSNSLRRANLMPALLYAPPADALAAIDEFQSRDPRLEPSAEKAWRDFVAARAGKFPAEAAARELTATPRGEYGIDPTTVMSAYALIGRLDEAFAEVERARPGRGEFYLANLFEPPTAQMRRDPRFMPLAARLGLVDYWTKSGHWPDFCQDPSLPYDCKAAAAAALKAAVKKG